MFLTFNIDIVGTKDKISGCYDDAQEMVDGNSTFQFPPFFFFFSWNNFVTSKLVWKMEVCTILYTKFASLLSNGQK